MTEAAQKKVNAIELKFGYQDKENPELAHRRVEFSRRPTGADFMRAIEATDGANPEYLFELMATAITKFGELPMPVPMTTLLSLNWIDQEDLQSTFFEFLGYTGAKDDAKILENGKVQLAFGVEREGVKYDTVEFGNILTGYDQIQIRKDAGTQIERDILTMGREIAAVSAADGSRKLDGGLTLDELKALDWEDFVMLKMGVEDWRDSFRKRGAKKLD